MIRSVAFASALWLLAASAAAQERWRAVTTPDGWAVFETFGASGCVITQDYGGPGRISLALSYDTSGEGSLYVLDRDRTFEEGAEFPLTVRLAGSPPSLGARAKGFRSGPRSGFRVLFRGEEFIGRYAAARGIAFFRGDARSTDRIYDFSLAGSGDAIRRMRQCLSVVRRRVAREDADRRRPAHIPHDPAASVPAPSEAAAAAPARRGVTPPQFLSGMISYADYPASALRERAEGTTTARLSVGADGRVTECTLVRSSGNGTLDSATCALMQRRFRFTPATDENGAAVAGTVTRSVRWMLPRISRQPAQTAVPPGSDPKK